MISEKNDRDEGSSSCSNSVETQHILKKNIKKTPKSERSPSALKEKTRTFSVLIAQGTFSHVGQLDDSLGAGIHEPIATDGMKLGRRDHLGQLLHVGGLDVDDIEALVLNLQVPEIDPQIVGAEKGLAIAVDGDAVDMIGVRVGVSLARDGRHHRIVMGQSRHLQRGGVGEAQVRLRSWGSSSDGTPRRQVARQVVLRHDPQHLLVHLP